MRRRVVESDICIIGSGISAAMAAEKITGERNASIVVLEAGKEAALFRNRSHLRRRYLAYGENPWPEDHIEGLTAEGIQSRSMQVGGLAMHWGGVTPRFSPEDFRVKSLYGVGDDWPIDYEDLDPSYQEAEERLGVAGEQGPEPLDPRNRPFPLPPIPLSYNLKELQRWTDECSISTWSQPSAKHSRPYNGRAECCRNDTCFPICPTGAKYSPDFTWDALVSTGRIDLHTETVASRIVTSGSSNRIEKVLAFHRDDPSTQIEFRARTFVVAAGYVWSSHLLLLSAGQGYPNGLANSSGLVGKFITGHRNVSAYIDLPLQIYPGMNSSHSLVSKQFMRTEFGPKDQYIRHDLRVWESSVGKGPRLSDDDGNLLFGNDLLADWRRRAEGGTARVRSYYDVLPHRESSISLDGSSRTPWGDPLPRIRFRDSSTSEELRESTEETIRNLFRSMAQTGNGRIISMSASDFQDHPAGGCRMGADPSSSVVDSYGRTHDHENLFVIGAPTCVTGGCANGTLTFVALALRAASQIGSDFSVRDAGQQ
ncbi:MAG: GMC family oxidoreductase [Gemmatimonadota bacterium]|nr:GMC family oxidoreductase [Gemmatimonadota bacterium]